PVQQDYIRVTTLIEISHWCIWRSTACLLIFYMPDHDFQKVRLVPCRTPESTAYPLRGCTRDHKSTVFAEIVATTGKCYGARRRNWDAFFKK
ncbi:hypothetical protein T310_9857, partial [Rasamsonia emersonii CBS 393.64]